MVLYLVDYNTLLQNATDVITKCDNYFIEKCGKSLLQVVLAFSLQNATTILLQNTTKVCYKMCQLLYYKMRHGDSYYKMRRYYYKMRHLFQNAIPLTECVHAWFYRVHLQLANEAEGRTLIR